jgi:ABC-type transport system involved in cytochrome bd biosynthesis fused ATPase/permease subunit
MVFDMVIPTAAIRLFAIVRTVARYAERLATHDAAFRFIARLRVNVFRSIAGGRGKLAMPRRRASCETLERPLETERPTNPPSEHGGTIAAAVIVSAS